MFFGETLDIIVVVALAIRWLVRVGYYAAGKLVMETLAQHWTTAGAVVQSVVPVNGSVAGIRIDYEYRVDGVYYGGSRIRECLTSEEAKEFSGQYVCRATYQVYYNPRQPAQSWLPEQALLLSGPSQF